MSGSPPGRMSGMDFTPWVLALMIGALGVVNIQSAAQVTAPNLYLYQATWLLMGGLAAILVGMMDYRHLEPLAYPFYVVVLVLLVLVLIKGRAILGAKRWLSLGVFNMQPSEPMKLALILTMARYLANWESPGGYTLRELFRPLNLSRPLGVMAVIMLKWAKLGDAQVTLPKLGWEISGTVIQSTLVMFTLLWLLLALFKVVRNGLGRRSLVAPMDIILVPVVLILVQPDLGTAAINLVISVSMVLFCGMRPMSVLIAVGMALGGSVVAWFNVLKPYQKRRVDAFLDPDSDALGAGYHANQSMIAIGSGGTQGKGFGAGTQTQLSFLPENHTDFVFSVLGEEWGLVGGAVLLLLFFLLLWAGISVASRAKDRFGMLLSMGVVAFIFWHVFINVGMVTGTLPVVGVTLPLMSYGGSSLMAIMGGVGVWLSVSNRRGR